MHFEGSSRPYPFCNITKVGLSVKIDDRFPYKDLIVSQAILINCSSLFIISSVVTNYSANHQFSGSLIKEYGIGFTPFNRSLKA